MVVLSDEDFAHELNTRIDTFTLELTAERNLPTRFVTLIAADDFDGIESARDDLEPHHVTHLIAHYATLQNWDQKRALVDLVQDQHHDMLRPMMLDFLRAPAGQYEALDIARAVALRFIDARYDRFEQYYNDRVLLEHDIATVLSDHGLAADTA